MNEIQVKSLEGLSTPALFILVLNALLFFLKRTPGVPNWTLPWISVGLGAIGYCLVQDEWIFRNILIGFGAGLMPVGLHQLLKETADEKQKVDDVRESDADKPTPFKSSITSNKLLALAASIVLATSVMGCKTTGSGGTNTEQAIQVAGIVQISAQLGTYSLVKREPDARPYFEAAVTGITVFLANGQTSPDELRELLSSLNITGVDAQEASLVLEAALTLYRTYYTGGTVDPNQPPNTQSGAVIIITGLRDGIRQGLNALATERKFELAPR